MKKSFIALSLLLSAPLFAENSTTIALPNGIQLTLKQGDITLSRTDVIVVPSNPQLAPGGGAGLALFNAAGNEKITTACQQFPILRDDVRCAVGDVVTTESGALLEQGVKELVHAVGPTTEDDRNDLLVKTYINSLDTAANHNLSSITLPAIATGAHGFPFKQATTIAINTIRNYRQSSVKDVVCIFRSEEQYNEAVQIAQEPESSQE